MNMTKSRGDDVFMPMTSADVSDGCNRWSADDSEEKHESCRLICGRVPISYEGGSFMFSLIIRTRLVYGFRLVWNLSPSRVWL